MRRATITAGAVLLVLLAVGCGRSDAGRAAPGPLATYTTCATSAPTSGACRTLLCSSDRCVFVASTPGAR